MGGQPRLTGQTAEEMLAARDITLPPFLIDLLRAHLDTHEHPHVFVTAENQLLRRSNFARRAMRPAADGNLDRTRPRVRVQPIVPGLVFHGFRHSHKTWMIADAIPDVGQARRLGHKIPDKIEHIYSHVAPEVETRLITALQHRWTNALTTLTTASALALPAAILPTPPAAYNATSRFAFRSRAQRHRHTPGTTPKQQASQGCRNTTST